MKKDMELQSLSAKIEKQKSEQQVLDSEYNKQLKSKES